ncbi:MAG TPA: hypothetical protein VD860_17525 [Azospirillum sp.]|nr:hypothetical protein [Azospirillum sp.]
MKKTVLAAALMAGMAVPAGAQELRVGLMSTLTGPQAVTGQHLRDGFMLGVEHAGGKLGGWRPRSPSSMTSSSPTWRCRRSRAS